MGNSLSVGHDTQFELKLVTEYTNEDDRGTVELRSTKFLKTGYDTGSGNCVVCGCSYTGCPPTCLSRHVSLIPSKSQ